MAMAWCFYRRGQQQALRKQLYPPGDAPPYVLLIFPLLPCKHIRARLIRHKLRRCNQNSNILIISIPKRLTLGVGPGVEQSWGMEMYLVASTSRGSVSISRETVFEWYDLFANA